MRSQTCFFSFAFVTTHAGSRPSRGVCPNPRESVRERPLARGVFEREVDAKGVERRLQAAHGDALGDGVALLSGGAGHGKPASARAPRCLASGETPNRRVLSSPGESECADQSLFARNSSANPEPRVPKTVSRSGFFVTGMPPRMTSALRRRSLAVMWGRGSTPK